MTYGPNYNPKPTRAWSRVENACPNVSNTVNVNGVPVSSQMLRKGNVLQYKANSSNLTKNQRYTQIAKGMWTNRTKSFATQSQTYSNPNTTSLLRVGATTIVYPNDWPGYPNNISGPFQYDIPNPFPCYQANIFNLQDGGNLVGNTYVNPCTGDIEKQIITNPCNPTSSSDVPGQVKLLCWDPRVQTWYPRQRYVMTNSFDKYPQGYKGFLSAIVPNLLLQSSTSNSITLTWKYCMPGTVRFNVYQNGVVVRSTTATTILINNLPLGATYTFYVTAVNNPQTESGPSNIINFST